MFAGTSTTDEGRKFFFHNSLLLKFVKSLEFVSKNSPFEIDYDTIFAFSSPMSNFFVVINLIISSTP